jgi:hypothetical protein
MCVCVRMCVCAHVCMRFRVCSTLLVPLNAGALEYRRSDSVPLNAGAATRLRSEKAGRRNLGRGRLDSIRGVRGYGATEPLGPLFTTSALLGDDGWSPVSL